MENGPFEDVFPIKNEDSPNTYKDSLWVVPTNITFFASRKWIVKVFLPLISSCLLFTVAKLGSEDVVTMLSTTMGDGFTPPRNKG